MCVCVLGPFTNQNLTIYEAKSFPTFDRKKYCGIAGGWSKTNFYEAIQLERNDARFCNDMERKTIIFSVHLLVHFTKMD